MLSTHISLVCSHISTATGITCTSRTEVMHGTNLVWVTKCVWARTSHHMLHGRLVRARAPWYRIRIGSLCVCYWGMRAICIHTKPRIASPCIRILPIAMLVMCRLCALQGLLPGQGSKKIAFATAPMDLQLQWWEKPSTHPTYPCNGNWYSNELSRTFSHGVEVPHTLVTQCSHGSLLRSDDRVLCCVISHTLAPIEVRMCARLTHQVRPNRFHCGRCASSLHLAPPQQRPHTSHGLVQTIAPIRCTPCRPRNRRAMPHSRGNIAIPREFRVGWVELSGAGMCAHHRSAAFFFRRRLTYG